MTCVMCGMIQKLVQYLLVTLVLIQPSLSFSQNPGVTRPLWAGASIDDIPTYFQISNPVKSLILALELRAVEEFENCVEKAYRLDEKYEKPPVIEQEIIRQLTFDTLTLTCRLSGLRFLDEYQTEFEYTDVSLVVSGTASSSFPQLYRSVTETNEGFEVVTLPVVYSARAKPLRFFMDHKNRITLIRAGIFGSILTQSQGSFNNLSFQYRLRGNDKEFESQDLRDSIDIEMTPRGIAINWSESDMNMRTEGSVNGIVSVDWVSIRKNENEQPTFSLTIRDVKLCSVPCHARIEHIIKLIASKNPIPANPSSGSIIRNARYVDRYEGTMNVTGVDEHGGVSVKWNKDLVIDRHHHDYWKQDLTTVDPNGSKFSWTWGGNVASEARFLPAYPERKFVQTNVQKSLDTESLNNEICVPGGEQACSGQPSATRIWGRTMENRFEKKVGNGSIQRTGTGSYDTNCPPQAPCGSREFALKGIFDSHSEALYVTEPSDWAGRRVDLWSLHQVPNSLITLEDLGYPNQSYAFSVRSGDPFGTVSARTSAITLVPQKVVLISGITPEERSGVFKKTFSLIDSVLLRFADHGSQVSQIDAQTAKSFISALESLPEGAVVILFVHGGLTGVYPGGNQHGGIEYVSGSILRDLLERKRAQAVYPLVCFAGRMGLPHAVLASIGVTFGGSSSGAGILLGLGTNPIHASAGQLMNAILSASGCRP